jgi:hypothetical protein
LILIGQQNRADYTCHRQSEKKGMSELMEKEKEAKLDSDGFPAGHVKKR